MISGGVHILLTTWCIPVIILLTFISVRHSDGGSGVTFDSETADRGPTEEPAAERQFDQSERKMQTAGGEHQTLG